MSYAGTLTPPGAPANTMYTLTDIFNLSGGTTTTLGTGAIPTTPSSVLTTFKTLTEIYDAISTQITNLANAKIASGISAFGFIGTLFGDTDASKVLTSATYAGTIPVKVNDNPVTGGTASSTSLLLTPPLGYYDGVATVSTTSANFIAGNIKSGVTLFGTLGTYSSGGASSAQPLKTNQTSCFDAAGTIISCTGTGQDGEYQKGAARSYTDPGDGTITDNTTGLTWKKCSQGLSGATCQTGTITSYTWINALAECEADSTAGQTDWRLPNVYELYSLVDFLSFSSPVIDSVYFPNTNTSFYWTSTTRRSNPSYAMYVSFSTAYNTNHTFKSTTYMVRCVRG